MESTVKIDDSGLKKMIADQRARLSNLKPAMEVIAQDMQTQKDMNFRKQQDPLGNKWESLKQSTLSKRRKGSKASKILQSTGKLRASFTTEATSRSAKIGTNYKIAATHQFGAKRGAYGKNIKGTSLKSGRRWTITIPWGDIPQRKMIGLTPAKTKKYNKIVLSYILTGKRR